MNYFTQEEALKIQASLKRFIGHKMKYAPNEEPSVITDIQVQTTMNEIAHYGEIQYGYLVNIVFEKHSGLVPALFCSFNGMDPIYATHEVLNSGRKNQIVTNKMMEGTWQFKNGEDLVQINISDGSVKIKGSLNATSVDNSFSSSGHWYSYYDFLFTEGMQYHIRSANDNEIIFGKLKQPSLIDGKFEWQKKFIRV